MVLVSRWLNFFGIQNDLLEFGLAFVVVVARKYHLHYLGDHIHRLEYVVHVLDDLSVYHSHFSFEFGKVLSIILVVALEGTRRQLLIGLATWERWKFLTVVLQEISRHEHVIIRTVGGFFSDRFLGDEAHWKPSFKFCIAVLKAVKFPLLDIFYEIVQKILLLVPMDIL